MSIRTRTATLEIKGRKASADGSFPCTVSTETPVTRRGPRGPFEEVLSHSPGAVNLARAPLPVIESHDRSKVNVGILQNLKVGADRRLRGDLVLGQSQRGRELAADVEAGIVTGISVGYVIDADEFDETAQRQTATAWTPFEVSIVSVPADVNAGIGRSADVKTEDQKRQEEALKVELARDADVLKRECERVAGITAACRTMKLPEARATMLIANGSSLVDARKVLWEEMATRSVAAEMEEGHGFTGADVDLEIRGINSDGSNPHFPSGYGQRGAHDDFRDAAVDGLLIRSGLRVAKPHAAARDMQAASIHDIARACVSREGKGGGSMLSPGNLIKRAFTTSDFPQILSNTVNKAIRMGYEEEPSTHRHWVNAVPVPDFKDNFRLLLSSSPPLGAVGEGGEYKQGSMSEDATSYRVAKYGNIVSLTLEILQNDRMSQFIRVQPAQGQAARRLEADSIYALFAENAAAGSTMQDGTVCFHADHKNLNGGSPLTAAGLGAARAKLRKQTALGGGFLSLEPKFLIVPPELETDAEVVIAQSGRVIVAGATGVVTPAPAWIGKLMLLVEPRLPSNAWYVVCDHNQIDTVELGLLEGGQLGGGPMLDQERGFEIDEMRFKVRHAFGAKIIDFKGMVKTPTI